MRGDAFRQPLRMRRIGIMCEGQPWMRHLCTVGAVKDGGVMVVPATKPTTGWAASKTAELITDGSVIGRAAVEPVAYPTTPTPKLHYHRSGFTSVQPDGGTRVAAHLPELGTVSRHTIFQLNQTAPEDLPSIEQWRKEDMFVVVHGEWPAAVSVAGIAYRRADIPHMREELVGTGAVQMARGERARLVLDLWAHALDLLVVIDFSSRSQVSPAAAATSLTGLCSDGMTPSAMVTLYSGDGQPSLALQMPWQMPTFPAEPAVRTTDRRRVQRNRDGTSPEFGDFF